MVGWYDPFQLLQTGQQVAISTLFGENADYRLNEAIVLGPAKIYDYSRLPNGYAKNAAWIDYVADVGDGWNSTYAVAYQVAQPSIHLPTLPGDLPRGELLIFGGDEVYPVASRTEYERRLVRPYRFALNKSDPPSPAVFAIPGNHDWYDSLVSFSRLFCAKNWFAGWRAPQTRSYFAIKLPHGWWLVGLDMQLQSDIDQAQIDYFEYVSLWEMAPTDRVIVCNAEPYWIYDQIYGRRDPTYHDKYQHYVGVLEKLFCGRVALLLAGDLHHYRRHEAPPGFAQSPGNSAAQKITAGGGGAFLHPTHRAPVSRLEHGDYRLAATFPSIRRSWWLSFRDLLFPWWNPWFGILPAIFYSLFAWNLRTDVAALQPINIRDIIISTLQTFESPGAIFWPAMILGSFLLFTDSHRRVYRVVAGLLHGSSHLVAALGLNWVAQYWALQVLRNRTLVHVKLLSVLFTFIGGYLIGSLLMGVYLFASFDIWGRHSNESFSALRIEDWKSFLKIKIDEEGAMIFPVGIRRVPRRWRMRRPTDKTGSLLVPSDRKATGPELIEKPIRVA